MKAKGLVVLLASLVAAIAAPAAKAVTPLRPAPTPPDTESVLILHGAFNYPGYWWDHTDLTVAVQAHPNVDDESLAAVHQAIADWDFALRQEFGGLITLTGGGAGTTELPLHAGVRSVQQLDRLPDTGPDLEAVSVPMRPTSVSMPVPTTSARPRPATTVVVL